MSYILDALKKSEQDRGNGTIPSVQTIHSSSLNYHQEKRPLWPWLLVAALTINIAILVYFLKPEANTNAVINKQQAEQSNVIIQEENTATENNFSSTPVPAPEIETPVISSPIVEQPAPVTTNHSNVATIVVDIDDLPANIRQQIPDMIFSAHVYSSEPMQRSLVINNRFMEEGHAISRDLTLVEITPNGAIFDFGAYRFTTGILSGWSTH